ncbi:DNA repair protein XRCC1-like isoform X2 [Lethenteron reissneri]|uniref:DNA repair protein XRCC1-like isoform X2 n=1 Tax=Lethenteron reissneri TaxID=7753 RepID=UPI002AB60868|nr:DNA repair protein XRCC1-like isoform X2 [Lethenteron reissneri]
MPPVKLRHVVSCSSEDPLHRVDNLLSGDAHRKWRCLPGEKEASFILQFEKAEKILSVDVGNEGSAFVEILVGNSSSNDSDFQALLSASCFMSPAESRSSQQRSRVRMFGPELLCRSVREQRWDRARVVCRQPYNSSLAYGLAFIRFNSVPEDSSTDDAPQAKQQEQRLGGFRLRDDVPSSSSGGGCLAPGGLFSSRQRHPLLLTPPTPPAPHTLSYARAALGDLPGSPSSPSSTIKPQAACLKRKFDLPVTSQPRKRRPQGEWGGGGGGGGGGGQGGQGGQGGGGEGLLMDPSRGGGGRREGAAASPAQSSFARSSSSSNNNNNNHNNNNHGASKAGSARGVRSPPPAASAPPASPGQPALCGVVVSLSGFTNPLRSTLRDLALGLGARYRPDWGPGCTHLVCAFARTPKSRQAQAAGALVVRREWLEDSAAQGRRLAERRYLMYGDGSSSEDEEARPSRRPNRTPSTPAPPVRWIAERVQRVGDPVEQRAERTSLPAARVSTPSPQRTAVNEVEEEVKEEVKEKVKEEVEEVTEEEVTEEEMEEEEMSIGDRDSECAPSPPGALGDPYDGTTEEEEAVEETQVGGRAGGGGKEEEAAPGPPELPDLLSGKRILLHASLSAQERRSLQRLTVAWNGSVVADGASEEVDFVIANHGWDESFDEVLVWSPAVLFVRPRWLLESLRRGSLAPPQPFAIAP